MVVPLSIYSFHAKGFNFGLGNLWRIRWTNIINSLLSDTLGIFGGYMSDTLFGLWKLPKRCYDLSPIRSSLTNPRTSNWPSKICQGLQLRNLTLPETNSSHLKINHPKRKLVFQPSILMCYLVSGSVTDILLDISHRFKKKIACFSISAGNELRLPPPGGWQLASYDERLGPPPSEWLNIFYFKPARPEIQKKKKTPDKNAKWQHVSFPSITQWFFLIHDCIVLAPKKSPNFTFLLRFVLITGKLAVSFRGR